MLRWGGEGITELLDVSIRYSPVTQGVKVLSQEGFVVLCISGSLGHEDPNQL